MIRLFKPSSAQMQKYETERKRILSEYRAADPAKKHELMEQLSQLSKKGLALASFDMAQFYSAKLQSARSRLTVADREEYRKKAHEYMLLYAKQGEAREQFVAGTYFEYGTDQFPADEAHAFQCYQMAAKGGNPAAMVNLGRCYYYAKGVDRDYVAAAGWYLQAAEHGRPKAWINLGLMYQDGKGVAVDLYKAEGYYLKAIELFEEKLADPSSEPYHSVQELRQELEDGKEHLERLRVQMLCDSLRNGRTLREKEKKELVEQLRSKAMDGNYRAQFEMAVACTNGSYGLQQDYGEAMKWYQMCEPYLGGGSYGIGYLYRNGLGVEQDTQKAVEYYIKAEKASNHRQACNELGVCYEKGIGVAADLVRALDYYRRAAEQGSAYSQMKCGYFLENGIATPRNEVEAAGWYEKVVDQFPRSQEGFFAAFRLGCLYFEGRGVPKDIRKAKELLTAAAANGVEGAQQQLDKMPIQY